MKPSVSIDIEACGEVIISVGAIQFDEVEDRAIGSDFYVVLDVQQQLDAGLKMDGGAFMWWLRQSDEARSAVTQQAPVPVVVALDMLRTWWPDRESRTWAYPTSYDLPVIARVCSAFKVRPPWKWTETMDCRTLWKLAVDRDPKMALIEKQADKGNEHNALEDARQQAGWVVKYLRALR